MLLNAGEGFVERQSGELALGKLAGKILAFLTVQFLVVRRADAGDEAGKLFLGERFHGAKAVRMVSADTPSAASADFSARRASWTSL